MPVATDYFTKWTGPYMLKTGTAATKLVEEFIIRFGVPRLHSETSSRPAVFVCHQLDIDKTRTTPLHQHEIMCCVTTQMELLAVAIAISVKRFHHYLYCWPFKIRTDHGALRWLANFKTPEI